jgi:hypothetical protein
MKTPPVPSRFVTALAIALPVLTSACTDRDCKRADKLPLRVQSYCGQLAQDLKSSAQEYANDAPRLNATDPDQRQRIEETLEWRSVGVSRDARRQALVDLQARLNFCVQARTIDDTQMTGLQVRIETLLKQLGPDLVTGQLPTVDETVTALRDLAAVASQVNALPLVD